jgi:hypothetical protein
MQRRIITTFLALAALAPATAAHATGSGQDPLLSGYGSPGTGEQMVLPAPAAGTGKAAAAARTTLDPAVTESPEALAAPPAPSHGSSAPSHGSSTGGRPTRTQLPELTTRPVAERKAIVAAATAGRAESPLFDTSDLYMFAAAAIALAGFALTARSNRRHG